VSKHPLRMGEWKGRSRDARERRGEGRKERTGGRGREEK